MNKQVLKLAVAGLAVAATSAHAAIDTTAITTELSASGTAAVAVGVAVLVVVASIKAVKMIRQAM